jgi:hypothetical protein
MKNIPWITWLALALPPVVLAGFERADFVREVDFGREALLARENLVREKRATEAQAGKEGIDLQGNRVRYERYVQRPAPDRIDKIFLTRRHDRTDQAHVITVFNRDLPTDLRDVYPGETPLLFGNYFVSLTPLTYFPTHMRFTATNGRDRIVQDYAGGQLYASGDYRVYFDYILQTYNDAPKYEARRSGQNPTIGFQGIETVRYPDATGALTSPVAPTLVENVVEPMPDDLARTRSITQTWQHQDGSRFTRRTGLYDEDLRPGGVSVLGLGDADLFQFVYSATEFQGRTIDVFVPDDLYALP